MPNQPERFLPVISVLQSILEENFPDLSTGPGSAIYDTVLLPSAAILQRFRDTQRVLQRNASLRNYATMLPDELDRLASNFLVSRREGTRATGTQRVVFGTIQEVVIDAQTVFSTLDGRTYRPIAPVRVSAVEMASRLMANGREFYVDVPIIADATGSGGSASAGTIVQATGILGAVRTFNLADLTGGKSADSNSLLYARVLSSVTNRDLVKTDAIRTAILDAFAQVTSVVVQGYGDPYMTRDVVSVTTGSQPLITASFCQKVNLPLDQNGDVLFASGSTQAVGGFAGAIYDVTGLDFSAVSVSLSDIDTKVIPFQAGYILRLLSADDPDAAKNDYVITRIESVPIVAGGPEVPILRVNKVFDDTSVIISDEQTPYTVIGLTTNDRFHVGGKVDVYLTSTGEQVSSVIVNALPEVQAGSDEAQVPLAAEWVDPTGASLFENLRGFSGPVLQIERVEMLDPASVSTVIDTLIEGEHYFLVRAGSSPSITEDTLVIRGEEADVDPVTSEPTGLVIPRFIGQRIKVTYRHNPDYAAVQAYLDREDVRDITKDIKVQLPQYGLVDIELTYSGAADTATVESTLRSYVNSLGFAEGLAVSDLVTLLTHFNVTNVKMPVTLTLSRVASSGVRTITQSFDILTAEPIELLRAGAITVSKV